MLLRLEGWLSMFWSWNEYIWTIYKQKLHDSAFLKNFANYKDDINLDHSHPIQKIAKQKWNVNGLENNNITVV